MALPIVNSVTEIGWSVGSFAFFLSLRGILGQTSKKRGLAPPPPASHNNDVLTRVPPPIPLALATVAVAAVMPVSLAAAAAQVVVIAAAVAVVAVAFALDAPAVVAGFSPAAAVAAVTGSFGSYLGCCW